ncbi:glucosylceramidase [Streptomyces albus]|uniref:Glucosylceramidase n=1 Tax=Streptomyces albus (strain ATCC 21838 / DSM 41398 / FERM P-419 / JCM 4703 / NBRC 107858) TaxID=1081613 RepID=A0A0B5EVH3_STRA4|nr:glucosylceramidase [Streptomyces albus]AOU76399.1 glucosylceramidase [Streptomyces albus]AYN32186.1 glucosylceramidase [Streptomyces albus]
MTLPRRARRPRALAAALLVLLALGGALTASEHGVPRAVGEPVTVWLTTTDDKGGRHVVRGLEKQRPFVFREGTGGPGVRLGVDEHSRFQPFTGGGASFTDSAAWLLNSSGALPRATREKVMRRLFSPEDGIGLSFLRNPMGASDLARYPYSYDDLPEGKSDPDLSGFSLRHDLADVVPLTRQALRLNPELTVMASPWSAPGWMKDSGKLRGGWLNARYYGTYARYFVKYLRGYRDQGIPVRYVTVQNEPTCCAGYPSMSWSGTSLHYFTKEELLPRLKAAGLSTKVLAHDWNWNTYQKYGAPTVDDPEVRRHPNFGGVAWHGYGSGIDRQQRTHSRYPGLPAFGTEHSGGDWVDDQQSADMHDIIDYSRNWARSVTKWSLALDQDQGPHSGGCGVCTGLVTVHHGDGQPGRVEYTVEYYTMGHLTKFVRPGARRIASTASEAVPNVAWRNPDGSKALIAYNESRRPRTVTLDWGGAHATYTLPGRTSATFTWSGAQGAAPPALGEEERRGGTGALAPRPAARRGRRAAGRRAQSVGSTPARSSP